MQASVCITGLRSVGKTTAAKALAQIRGMPCYDTDEMADRCLAARGSSFVEEMKLQRYGEIYEAILSELPSALNYPCGSIISAAWGCFEQPELAQLLHARTFVVGLIPVADAELAADILFSRERVRPHFGYLDDAGLMELCRRDAARALNLLTSRCHVILEVGSDSPEMVQNQLISAIWP